MFSAWRLTLVSDSSLDEPRSDSARLRYPAARIRRPRETPRRISCRVHSNNPRSAAAPGGPRVATLVVDGQSRLDTLAQYHCAGLCRIDGERGELCFAQPGNKIATTEATGDQLGRFAYRLFVAA